jgi:hypothetical protein
MLRPRWSVRRTNNEEHEKRLFEKNEKEEEERESKNKTRRGKMLSFYEYPGLAVPG